MRAATEQRERKAAARQSDRAAVVEKRLYCRPTAADIDGSAAVRNDRRPGRRVDRRRGEIEGPSTGERLIAIEGDCAAVHVHRRAGVDPCSAVAVESASGPVE